MKMGYAPVPVLTKGIFHGPGSQGWCWRWNMCVQIMVPGIEQTTFSFSLMYSSPSLLLCPPCSHRPVIALPPNASPPLPSRDTRPSCLSLLSSNGTSRQTLSGSQIQFRILSPPSIPFILSGAVLTFFFISRIAVLKCASICVFCSRNTGFTQCLAYTGPKYMSAKGLDE